MSIPDFLNIMLKEQYGDEITKKIIEGLFSKRYTTFRVNTLKSSNEEIENFLQKENIDYEKVSWSNNAIILKNCTEKEISETDIYKDGKIYMQSLSSMLPPIILNPREGSDILDMTAAPGGKTTQIAALTNNKAHITACEMNKIRIEKLKYNVDKQGAKCVYIMQKDSRQIEDFFSFDQILLDSPCSGSGTIDLNDENLYKYFNENLINKCVKTQSTLLKKAIRILKKGHEMVYSTCSILSKENENIILNEMNNNKNVEIVPIELNGMEDIPKLPTKIPGTLCVCPNEKYEGFFVAKIKKV